MLVTSGCLASGSRGGVYDVQSEHSGVWLLGAVLCCVEAWNTAYVVSLAAIPSHVRGCSREQPLLFVLVRVGLRGSEGGGLSEGAV
jgi:hypothetical protein